MPTLIEGALTLGAVGHAQTAHEGLFANDLASVSASDLAGDLADD